MIPSRPNQKLILAEILAAAAAAATAMKTLKCEELQTCFLFFAKLLFIFL